MPGKHTWDIQDLVQREWVQVYVKSLNHVWLSVILWTAVCQAPPSMGFPRQDFWSGLPFPSPGDLPDLGIEPGSPAWQADTSPSEPPGKPWATLLTQAERFQLLVDCFWDLNVPCILCLAKIKLDLIYNLCSLHNDKILPLSQRVLEDTRVGRGSASWLQVPLWVCSCSRWSFHKPPFHSTSWPPGHGTSHAWSSPHSLGALSVEGHWLGTFRKSLPWDPLGELCRELAQEASAMASSEAGFQFWDEGVMAATSFSRFVPSLVLSVAFSGCPCICPSLILNSSFYPLLVNSHYSNSLFQLIPVYIASMHAQSLRSCLTLCDPMDHSPPGSWVLGILQARILEWVAVPFSRVPPPPKDQTRGSCIAGRFFTIWATREAPVSPPLSGNCLLRETCVEYMCLKWPSSSASRCWRSRIRYLDTSHVESHIELAPVWLRQ